MSFGYKSAWDKDKVLIIECTIVVMGNLVGSEMETFGINLWLAPALNIQRSPLCVI